MVQWYDPRQLLVTGMRVLLSYLLRERVDRRVMDAFVGRQRVFDYSDCVTDDGELWLDYVADVGDGYDSTYEVARQLARRELTEITTADGKPLRRGSILMMGGDQVYPAASRTEYDNRLRLPYERAFPAPHDPQGLEDATLGRGRHPAHGARTGGALCQLAPDPVGIRDRELGLGARPGRALYAAEMDRECVEPGRYPGLFAIPGNHDWYDGLACFTRLFCQQRSIGGLQTYQNRSYFALALPHNWWLLAIDIQLTDYIDKPQRDYFENIIERMDDDDNVILCMGTPSWEPEEGFAVLTKEDFWSSRDSHEFLEKRIFRKAHIKLWLSGDLHYYRRYECRVAEVLDGERAGEPAGEPDEQPDGASEREPIGHMVTCGGGGAFLHPTHTRRKRFQAAVAGRRVEMQERAAYPDRALSRKLASRHFWRLFNPRNAYGVGMITSLMYLVLGWHAVPAMARLHDGIASDQIWKGGLDFAFYFVLHPFALFWLSVFLAMCYGVTPEHYKGWTRASSAMSHLFSHLVAITGLSVLGLYLAPEMAGAIEHAVRWLTDAVSLDTEMIGFDREELEFMGVAVVAVGGFWLGKIVMAGYLIIAVTIANVQGNNAFAMLRIPDYKCFLRMRVCRDRLEVYAIRIDRVGRHGRARGNDPSSQRDGGRPAYPDADPDADPDAEVGLIECFTVPARVPADSSSSSSSAV